MPDNDGPTTPKVQGPETPEEVMLIWRKKIEELPKMDHAETEARLMEIQSLHIPTDLLLPEGYIRLFGKLQNLLSEASTVAALVNRHYKTRVSAIKSMQAILQGMSTRKSVAEREAEAEGWLIYVQRAFVDIDTLNDLAKATIDIVKRASADAVQQMKSINQFGVPTGLLDASQAVQIPAYWADEDSEN